MKKIGIVRGLMPRTTHAEFASTFSKLIPRFITGKAEDEVSRFCKRENLDHIDLKMKPIPGIYFDPFYLFSGKYLHQSWVTPRYKDMLEVSRDLDVLETYEAYHLFSGVAADVSRKLHIPLVTEIWTSFRHLAYYLPPYSIAALKSLSYSELIIARSEKAKQALLKMRVPEKKIKVLYHGVNIHRFMPKKGNANNINVLFVGSMTKEKGVDILKSAWQKIIQKNNEVMLHLVGAGPLLESFKDVRGVKIYGWTSHDMLQNLYSKADIFVSPSINRRIGPLLWWEEFFSYTLMEAQAAGLAIIGSDSGGIPEEIGNDNIIVPQGSVGELVDALATLITDSKLRKRLQNNNRKRAEELFDLDKQVEKLEYEILKII